MQCVISSGLFSSVPFYKSTGHLRLWQVNFAVLLESTLTIVAKLMAKGHAHKKLKTLRKVQRTRYKLRSDAAHVHTAAFLACPELVLYHFLNACTLASLIALSHTSVFFRTLVKTLHRIRLLAVIEHFVGRENVHRFFEVLEVTDSAVGGSTLLRVLTPPTNPSGYDWMPSNLNIYVPLGSIPPWNDFFSEIKLSLSSSQPGVAFPYKTVTNSHTLYHSRVSVSCSVCLSM